MRSTAVVARPRPVLPKFVTQLFRPWHHALVTIVLSVLLIIGAISLYRWAIADAVFGRASPDTCRAAAGACWAFLVDRYNVILFGNYPSNEYWRPALSVVLVLSVLIASGFRRLWGIALGVAWIAAMIATVILMAGGVFGLEPVSTSRWGGLPLTVGLSAFGIVLALPLSVALAFGRRSQAPAIKAFCDWYVEIVRGLPLIAVLFFASAMLPFMLPAGSLIDTILRAQIALVLFQAAYLAEVIRAGLEAVPKGQIEAARSMGLPEHLVSRLVVMPQAFRIALPSMINTFIESIKDTTLVSVIGLIDVLGGARGAIADGTWLGFYREAYIAVGLAFFAFCYILSMHSRRLEREFSYEHR
jgi:general L-amino acid transport system permease protein